MNLRALALLSLLAPTLAFAQLDKLSNQDAVAGLKAALEKGAGVAVSNLGRADGFLGNPQVKIPLPDSLKSADRMMRTVGMGKYSDELVVTMNRAAEAAAPEAKDLFVKAVKDMSVQDAKGILTGGDTAGTEYFKRATSDQLRERFLPIVRRETQKLSLAQKYNEYAEKGAKFGLVGKDAATIDDYVTQKTLDGLFFMVAEEEKKIRANPVAAGSALLSKVFGALK